MISAEELSKRLRGYRLPVTIEAEMQTALGNAFELEGLEYKAEVIRRDGKQRDRIDFVVGRVGVECKVHCPTKALVLQLARYANWDTLDELLVVTSDGKHIQVPRVLNGKPVIVHVVRGML